eukprot:13886286-Ditylum_brightwellii.AAC.1
MPESCMLLDLNSHPSIGAKRILFEGWRTILLPKLLQCLIGKKQSQKETISMLRDDDSKKFSKTLNFYPHPFVWVAEDDVRFPLTEDGGLCPHRIYRECMNVFSSNPDVDILSLGHAWKGVAKQRKNSGGNKCLERMHCTKDRNRNTSSLLLNHLKKGGGVHGTTLLAIRFPKGAQKLLNALEICAKRRQQIIHFDQFLFHSTLHDLGVAFSDPPVVGWAE